MKGKIQLLSLIAISLTACSSGVLTADTVLERTELVDEFGGPKLTSCEHFCSGWSPYSPDEAARRIDNQSSWTKDIAMGTLKLSGPKVLIVIKDAPSGSVIDVTNLEGTGKFNPNVRE